MKNNTTSVIVVANQKGGVGKTKTANCIARDLAVKGYSVMLIDWDQQGTLTRQFKVRSDEIKNTLHDSYTIVKKDSFPQPKRVVANENGDVFLDMLFSSDLLKEFTQSGMDARELKLRQYTKKIKKEKLYDYIVVDTPGTTGLLLTNALISADIIVSPIFTAEEAVSSTDGFFKELLIVEDQFEHKIEKIIVFGNMFSKATLHDIEQLEIIKEKTPKAYESYKEVGYFSDTKYCVIKEAPNRTVVKNAMGSGYYLRDYIKTHANTKSNRELLETYDAIFKEITGQEFHNNTTNKG